MHIFVKICLLVEVRGAFLKLWYPTTMGFPTKNDHFGVFWGYVHLRKHPHIRWDDPLPKCSGAPFPWEELLPWSCCKKRSPFLEAGRRSWKVNWNVFIFKGFSVRVKIFHISNLHIRD